MIFGGNFSAWKEHKRKQFRYFEIKHIDDPCILTNAVNPEEYFEMFENKGINKKHNGIKKDSSGLGFENFSQRIKSLDNFDTFQNSPVKLKEVSRRTVKAAEMKKTNKQKNKRL